MDYRAALFLCKKKKNARDALTRRKASFVYEFQKNEATWIIQQQLDFAE